VQTGDARVHPSPKAVLGLFENSNLSMDDVDESDVSDRSKANWFTKVVAGLQGTKAHIYRSISHSSADYVIFVRFSSASGGGVCDDHSKKHGLTSHLAAYQSPGSRPSSSAALSTACP
jgi:hypothetical protein